MSIDENTGTETVAIDKLPLASISVCSGSKVISNVAVGTSQTTTIRFEDQKCPEFERRPFFIAWIADADDVDYSYGVSLAHSSSDGRSQFQNRAVVRASRSAAAPGAINNNVRISWFAFDFSAD
jgi:hypothetical protein